MILVQNYEFILSEYKKTFAPDEAVFPPQQTYWLGCYSADATLIIENLPSPPFSLIVETPASGDLHQLWYDTFKDLIRAGVTDFHSYGPRSEELHDIFDWADVELNYLGDTPEPEDDAVLLSTWSDDLPEALESQEVLNHFREPSNCVVLSLCPEGSSSP